jgi:hypothetical protein
MKNNFVRSLFFIFFLFFIQLTQAQDSSLMTSGLGEKLTFSGVMNGYTFELKIPAEKADLSSFQGISADVYNTGSDLFRIEGYLNDKLWINSCIYLEPGENKQLEILFKRTFNREASIFPAMNGLPGGTLWLWDGIDPGNIDKITFKIFTKGNATFSISDIKPFGEIISPQKIAASPRFYPFIDKFGQFKHAVWSGKITNESEFIQSAKDEEALLELIPEPDERNRFGGWAKGPKREATGNFRTEKVNSKWWLIDPEGCLFWSHGITCVNFNNAGTRISDREKFFENLPGISDPLSVFYSISPKDTMFNFTGANLYRKYGVLWKEKSTENALKRLRSWGMNSFGNWSDPDIYLSPGNRIPYTVGVSPKWPKIDGKVAKFPNVFDPGFRDAVKIALNNLDVRIKNDPYCIGFFIDNELDLKVLTSKLMMQPEHSVGKQAFIDYLKNRYVTVKKLNETWKTSYSDWQQIGKLSGLSDGARDDIEFFDHKMIDLYYKTCFEEVKLLAPNKLYFGSRLHCHYFPDDQSESQIIKIAANYCDVVCFNRYRFSAEDLILPFGIDKATIIGEFHFGALDRGLAHTGLRSVANQDQRAEAYFFYVEGALRNPQIVGTHWFQYGDQAYTGRNDGENYQIGFVDICDNPYPEMIRAVRKIGYTMYRIRNME